LKRISSIGHKSYKLGEVERTEALSESNFQNALKLFGEKGIVTKKLPKARAPPPSAPPPTKTPKTTTAANWRGFCGGRT
jgi:hypothetical protein